MNAHIHKPVLLLAAAAWLLARAASADSIVHSKHDLSVSGGSDYRAVSQTNSCIFCHTVHRSSGAAPLWNHALSSVTNYIVYASATLQATVGQPDGSSRLCLSCHDGTVALGMVNSRQQPIPMQNGVTTMPAGMDNLGTDLSSDHPISFRYDAALVKLDSNLKDPAQLNGPVRLDRNSEVQCTSCHDPHNNQFGNFLVADNTGSALCLNCHVLAGWSGSGHALSSKLITPAVKQILDAATKTPALRAAAKPAPPQSVAAGGCANCHAPHFAGGKERLLKFQRPEQNCFSCHRANGVGKDLMADFQKASVHPITLDGSAHQPDENPVNPHQRHVTCADCHNPHAVAASSSKRAQLSGALTGVTGVAAGGVVVKSATREYELCFRCHGDSIARGPAHVSRQFPETNKRLQFSVGNQSFHPVEGVGKNAHVPSLIAPWTTASTVACTDCHNSDQSPAAGGTGANGPHGSSFAPLLERQLVITDFGGESAANYALCYKCHSRDNILGDQSFHATGSTGGDRGHRFHIVEQRAACTTCHDSHGVAASAHLVNFNVSYVSPASNGRLQYLAGTQGPGSGTCTLQCHGYDHVNSAYGPAGLAGLRRPMVPVSKVIKR